MKEKVVNLFIIYIIDGKTALGIASCKKDLFKVAKTLINSGANINHTSSLGIGPLTIAI